jgi:Na+/H+ antiporter NhaC
MVAMKLLKYGLLLVLVCSLFFLPDPDTDYLFLQTVNSTSRAWFDEEAGKAPVSVVRLEDLAVSGAGVNASADQVEREIRQALVLHADVVFVERSGIAWAFRDGQVTRIDAPPAGDAGTVTFSCRAVKEEDEGRIAFIAAGEDVGDQFSEPFFRWYAILPPFVAIALALLFQKTIIALFCGVWLGATLLSGLNPLAGLWLFARKYLYEEALLDQFRIEIIGFVIFLCAMVGVLSRGGGIRGFVNLLVRFAKSVRSTQLATYFMGLAIFFDDYSNCILVGSIMRPLSDRMRISREKLSYIVDSTAAPIAGLSMLSTWIAYEVSTFSAQLPEAGVSQGGYEIFIMTLPFRFYCIFTLLFILLVIVTGRDFGPMLRAERRARATGEVVRPGSRPMVSAEMTRIEVKKGVPERWFNAVVPIVFVVLFTLEEFWRIGGGWQRPLSDLFSATAIREVLSRASDISAARPIFLGSVAGFVLAVLLLLVQRILSLKECLKAAVASTKALFFAVAILFLAWCIGGVCSDIGTAHYLIALFKGVIPPLIFPIILFLTACLVSFCTGSSWSTMSILLPNTVLFAVKMGELSDIGSLPMLVISIGAVLEGSIFGDHCSPISDTTILSSVSSASDHLDHVKTQIPYAVLTMSAAILCGYLPAAAGTPAPVSLAVGAAVLVAGIFLLGRKAGGGPQHQSDTLGG